MSNELTLPQFTLPDFVNVNLPDIGLTEGLSTAPPRISLRNSRFNLVENGSIVETISDPFLKVVIVGSAPAVQRAFYAGSYDPNVSTLPDCMSEDGNVPVAGPSRQYATCHGCPQNVKQADPRRPGSMYTPCSFFKMLAVVPLMMPELKVYSLRLSAMTLFSKKNDPASNSFGLKPYSAHLESKQLSPVHVVTALIFDSSETVPALKFALAGVVGHPVNGVIEYTEEKFNQISEFLRKGDAIKEAILLPTLVENSPPTTSPGVNQQAEIPPVSPDPVSLYPPVAPNTDVTKASGTDATSEVNAVSGTDATSEANVAGGTAATSEAATPQGASIDAFINEMQSVSKG